MQQQHALEVSSEFFDLAGDTAQRLLASGGTLVSIGAVATGYGGAVTTEASDHVMDPGRISWQQGADLNAHEGSAVWRSSGGGRAAVII